MKSIVIVYIMVIIIVLGNTFIVGLLGIELLKYPWLGLKQMFVSALLRMQPHKACQTPTTDTTVAMYVIDPCSM